MNLTEVVEAPLRAETDFASREVFVVAPLLETLQCVGHSRALRRRFARRPLQTFGYHRSVLS